VEESEVGQQGQLGARPSQQPLPAVSPARPAYPLALASFVLAVIGTILGGLEVGLMASFFDASFPDNMPDPLTPLVFFSLFAAIPVGIVAAVLSNLSRRRANRLGGPQHMLANWGMALGFLAIVLGLIGCGLLFAIAGEALNTIGAP
jgi:hypothetical protein